VWNEVAAELIGAVRGNDPRRTILIGPRTMNNQRFLAELSLPEDERNLIRPATRAPKSTAFPGVCGRWGRPSPATTPPLTPSTRTCWRP
jgi:hypothetical protein